MAKAKHSFVDYVWAAARISIGLIFLWAFFDKLLGLGMTTCAGEANGCASAWLEGGSPTNGFLAFAADGPFQGFYNNIAGNSFVDLLFMTGLFGVGFGLTFGVGVKLASYSGILLLMMMWSAVLPPEHHPFLDDHIVYSIVLLGVAATNKKQALGFGHWWRKQQIVKDNPILE